MKIKSIQPTIVRFSLYAGSLLAVLILLAMLLGHVQRADQILFLSKHSPSTGYKLYGLDIGRGITAKVNNAYFTVGDELRLTISPDREHVLYLMTAENDYSTAIFMMKLSGGDNHQLVDIAGTTPSWSPDSQSIVFAALGKNQAYTRQIYRVNSDGMAAQQLTEFAEDESAFSPDWSPDGKQIFFRSMVDSSEMRFYVMNADGTVLQRISYSVPYYDILSVKWSPDSRRVAFVARLSIDGRVGISTSLCVSETTLTNVNCFDNASLGTLTDSAVHSFDWSPDSAQIAFVSAYAYATNIPSILIFDIATATTHLVVRHNNDASVKSIGDLIWTPDGCCLIYEVWTPTGGDRVQLYSINIDGSDERNLTNNEFANIQPLWWPGE